MSEPVQRTFLAYVEDCPGVLNRVSSLFRRRGFNIESFTVGQSDRPGVSRMTFVVKADEHGARRIEATLYKLIQVISVKEITDDPSVVCTLALIKVKCTASTRLELLCLSEELGARQVDVTPASMILEFTTSPQTIPSLLAALRPFGILEMVQTGAVAMQRGGGQAQTHEFETQTEPQPLATAIAA